MQSESCPAACRLHFPDGTDRSGKTGLALNCANVFRWRSSAWIRHWCTGVWILELPNPMRKPCKRAPHRLIDIRDPSESYSAADFRNDALREMKSITAAGKVPLLVGGTMLYFRALEHGLSELPAADPEVRKQLEQQAADIGWPAMHGILQQKDPAGCSTYPSQ